jgi:hypothetical protein
MSSILRKILDNLTLSFSNIKRSELNLRQKYQIAGYTSLNYVKFNSAFWNRQG